VRRIGGRGLRAARAWAAGVAAPAAAAAALALGASGAAPARAEDPAPAASETRQAPARPQDRTPGEAAFGMLMQRGLQALESQEFAAAVQLLERAVAAQRRSAAAHYQLGRAYAGLKRTKPAEAHYTEALALHPRHPGALMGLAAIAELTGEYAAAEGHYRGAVAAGAGVRAERALASLLARTGRSPDAEAILARLLAADPNDHETRYELGLARELRGDCEGAIPEFRKVAEAQPGRATAHFHLGNCLSRAGRKDEAAPALARFQEITRVERRRLEVGKQVHFTLIDADRLAEAGRLDEAVAKAREAVGFDPGSARAHAFLGSLLAEAGRNEEALASVARASDLDPSDAVSATEAGRLHALAGRAEEAVAYLKRAVAADANLAEPHRFLAVLYAQMGRMEDAERERRLYLSLGGGR
jgi:tetratricopeptide (TPR) repeat protein